MGEAPQDEVKTGAPGAALDLQQYVFRCALVPHRRMQPRKAGLSGLAGIRRGGAADREGSTPDVPEPQEPPTSIAVRGDSASPISGSTTRSEYLPAGSGPDGMRG